MSERDDDLCHLCGKPVEPGQGARAVGPFPALHSACLSGADQAYLAEAPRWLARCGTCDSWVDAERARALRAGDPRRGQWICERCAT